MIHEWNIFNLSEKVPDGVPRIAEGIAYVIANCSKALSNRVKCILRSLRTRVEIKQSGTLL